MSDVNVQLNSILDATLDELADLKEFKPWPVGTYRAFFKFETKDINGKPAIIVKLKHAETIELASAGTEPPAEGSDTDVAYLMANNDGSKNEISEGKLKLILSSLKETFDGNKNREILEAAQGAEVLVTLRIRKNKNNPDQEFNDIVSLTVA